MLLCGIDVLTQYINIVKLDQALMRSIQFQKTKHAEVRACRKKGKTYAQIPKTFETNCHHIVITQAF
jgi:hypothetical protein